MAVDDAAAFLSTTWDTDATTVGGLVTAALGRLPSPGDKAATGGYEFEVERVSDRAVDSVLALRIQPEDGEDNA
jgi:CBS domain containing-hemolysin-like protein